MEETLNKEKNMFDTTETHRKKHGFQAGLRLTVVLFCFVFLQCIF